MLQSGRTRAMHGIRPVFARRPSKAGKSRDAASRPHRRNRTRLFLERSRPDIPAEHEPGRARRSA
jgi:hypothetical protein